MLRFLLHRLGPLWRRCLCSWPAGWPGDEIGRTSSMMPSARQT